MVRSTVDPDGMKRHSTSERRASFLSLRCPTPNERTTWPQPRDLMPMFCAMPPNRNASVQVSITTAPANASPTMTPAPSSHGAPPLGDNKIYEEIFATSVLGSLLLEQITTIRDHGRVLGCECSRNGGVPNDTDIAGGRGETMTITRRRHSAAALTARSSWPTARLRMTIRSVAG
jgi:hypothetical protein